MCAIPSISLPPIPSSSCVLFYSLSVHLKYLKNTILKYFTKFKISDLL